MGTIYPETLGEKLKFIRRHMGSMDNITNGNVITIPSIELQNTGITLQDLIVITRVLDLGFKDHGGYIEFWFDPA